MQIQSLNIQKQSSYASVKPGRLHCTVTLSDEAGNEQTVALSDPVIVAILEVVRDATVAQCKASAAEAKSALESAICAPALEMATALRLD